MTDNNKDQTDVRFLTKDSHGATDFESVDTAEGEFFATVIIQARLQSDRNGNRQNQLMDIEMALEKCCM